MNLAQITLPSWLQTLRAWLFHCYPHRWLSALVYGLARIEIPVVKNYLNTGFARALALDMSEAEIEDPKQYPTLDALFVRAMKPECRPWAEDPEVLASPCDCRISQIGTIEDGRIIQAKGQGFSVDELLGAEAPEFAHGHYATLYLSPRFCHRVYMPLPGRLLEMRHIPGRQFSVAPYATERIARLFARNERVVNLFEDEYGTRFAVVMVGAQNVASMEMSWCGVVSPRRHAITRQDYSGNKAPEVRLARGDEIGRFHFGSTVILLSTHANRAPAPGVEIDSLLHYGQPLLCPPAATVEPTLESDTD